MSLQLSNEVLLSLLSFKAFDSSFSGSYKFRFHVLQDSLSGAEPLFAKPYIMGRDSSACFSHRSFDSEPVKHDLNHEVLLKSLAGFRLNAPLSRHAPVPLQIEAKFLFKGLDNASRERFPEDAQGFSLLETRTIMVDLTTPVVEFLDLFFESVLPCRVRLLLAVYQTNLQADVPSLEALSVARINGQPQTPSTPQGPPRQIFNGPRIFSGQRESLQNIPSIPLPTERGRGTLDECVRALLEREAGDPEEVAGFLLEKQQRSVANLYCFLSETFDFVSKLDISDDLGSINHFARGFLAVEADFTDDQTRFLVRNTEKKSTFKFRAPPPPEPLQGHSSTETQSTNEGFNGSSSKGSSHTLTSVQEFQSPQPPSHRALQAHPRTPGPPKDMVKPIILKSHALSATLAAFQSLLLEMHPKFNQYFSLRARFDSTMKASAVNDKIWTLIPTNPLSRPKNCPLLIQQFTDELRKAAGTFQDQISRLRILPSKEYIQCSPLFFEQSFSAQETPRQRKGPWKASDFAPHQRFNRLQTKNGVLLSPDLIYCQPRSVCTHLVVLVHGFKGSEFDLRLFKSRLENGHRHLKCFNSSVNVGVENVSISALGANLAKEVREYVMVKRLQFIRKVSFIGHSLGGLIVRAAIPCLPEFQNYFHAYVSLGSPHLGMINSHSILMQAGFTLFKKVTGNNLLQQLDLSDAPRLEDTELYKLSQSKGLDSMRHVVFIGAREDGYGCIESAIVEPGDRIRALKEGPKLKAMADAINGNVKRPTFSKVNMEVQFAQRNLDWFIGRTPHILLIDNEEVVAAILTRLGAIFEEHEV